MTKIVHAKIIGRLHGCMQTSSDVVNSLATFHRIRAVVVKLLLNSVETVLYGMQS
jgi:hypothetical protein